MLGSDLSRVSPHPAPPRSGLRGSRNSVRLSGDPGLRGCPSSVSRQHGETRSALVRPRTWQRRVTRFLPALPAQNAWPLFAANAGSANQTSRWRANPAAPDGQPALSRHLARDPRISSMMAMAPAGHAALLRHPRPAPKDARDKRHPSAQGPPIAHGTGMTAAATLAKASKRASQRAFAATGPEARAMPGSRDDAIGLAPTPHPDARSVRGRHLAVPPKARRRASRAAGLESAMPSRKNAGIGGSRHPARRPSCGICRGCAPVRLAPACPSAPGQRGPEFRRPGQDGGGRIRRRGRPRGRRPQRRSGAARPYGG